MQYHEFTVQCQNNMSNEPYPGIDKVYSLSTDMNNLFAVFCQNLGAFAAFIENPTTKVQVFN